MWDRTGPSTWFPDRPPKRSEIVSVGCALALFLLHLPRAQSPSWQGVGVGFVAVGLALGPVSSTAIGGAVGGWFRAIGVGGRLAVIAFYCCALVLLLVFVPLPLAFLENAAIGGLIAVVLYVLAFTVWAGGAAAGNRLGRHLLSLHDGRRRDPIRASA